MIVSYRISIYCKNKYEEEWMPASIKITGNNSTINAHKASYHDWYQSYKKSYSGYWVIFFEYNLLTGKTIKVDEVKVLDLKDKPRILNDDSCSDPVQEDETNP